MRRSARSAPTADSDECGNCAIFRRCWTDRAIHLAALPGAVGLYDGGAPGEWSYRGARAQDQPQSERPKRALRRHPPASQVAAELMQETTF